MAHEVLPTPRVRALYQDKSIHFEKEILILAVQTLHMSLANSSDRDSAKLGRRALSLTRLMSQPPIHLVNTLPRYEDLTQTSSSSCTDSSLRAIASLEPNAHWHISFLMEEGLTARIHRLEGSSILAAGWILNYINNQTLR